ncbi:MAG: hypothetical protein ACYC4L_10075 [Chloroflexota bacterium]
MGKSLFTLTLLVAAALGLGSGASLAAWEKQQKATPTPMVRVASTAAAGTLSPLGGDPGGRLVTGNAQKVEGELLTVQAQGGNVVQVSLAGAAIRRSETGTLADVKVGDAATVVGQRQGEAFIADAVQLGGTDLPLAMAGAGQAGPQSGADRSRFSGKVEAVAADGFTFSIEDAGLSAPAGAKLKVVVPKGALVQKGLPATAADIKEGTRVVVTGQAGADGSVAAKSVVIMPAGVGGRGG